MVFLYHVLEERHNSNLYTRKHELMSDDAVGICQGADRPHGVADRVAFQRQ